MCLLSKELGKQLCLQLRTHVHTRTHTHTDRGREGVGVGEGVGVYDQLTSRLSKEAKYGHCDMGYGRREVGGLLHENSSK